jgi:hypothetical protein
LEELNMMQGDLVLPAFEMDCRDWLVVTPDDAGIPEEIAGAPLLAVLSTAVFDSDDFSCASAVLTVGLLDDDAPPAVPLVRGCVAAEVIDSDDDERSVRYLVPSPDGQLALLAEFSVDHNGAELRRRIEALMSSFRWTA